MHTRLATWFAGSTVWILLRFYCCVRKWTGLWSIRQSRYKHLKEYLWCVSHKGQHEARRLFFLSFNSQKYVVVVQLQSPVQLFVTPWTSAWQALLSFTISQSLLKLMPIELMMPSNHPLLPPLPTALNLPQHQGLFEWVGSSHQVAKVLGLQLQHQSFQ